LTMPLRIPEIGFIAVTRVALGTGLGLILADKLNRGQRRKTGRVLLAIGALTTIPLVINVVRKAKESVGIAA
jgi:hypothetical protein